MTNFTFFLIFVPILAVILLVVNLIFASHNPYDEKKSTFECGFHSFLGQNRTQFNISFFIFALLFLLFDLEILLIYPYSVSHYSNELYGLIIMLIFFGILTIGFTFEFGKKALKIDSKQIINKNYVLNNHFLVKSSISGNSILAFSMIFATGGIYIEYDAMLMSYCLELMGLAFTTMVTFVQLDLTSLLDLSSLVNDISNSTFKDYNVNNVSNHFSFKKHYSYNPLYNFSRIYLAVSLPLLFPLIVIINSNLILFIDKISSYLSKLLFRIEDFLNEKVNKKSPDQTRSDNNNYTNKSSQNSNKKTKYNDSINNNGNNNNKGNNNNQGNGGKDNNNNNNNDKGSNYDRQYNPDSLGGWVVALLNIQHRFSRAEDEAYEMLSAGFIDNHINISDTDDGDQTVGSWESEYQRDAFVYQVSHIDDLRGEFERALRAMEDQGFNTAVHQESLDELNWVFTYFHNYLSHPFIFKDSSEDES